MANRFLNNITVNDSYTFPSTDGSSGQAIITDGAGNLTFGSATAASADSAESVHISVKNTSGAQILKGTPVYVTGETGNSGKIEVAPADASDSAKMPALGLLESTLSNNAEGFCVQGGLLEGLATDTIDGTSTTANDTVYVKAGGGLTMTKPTGSNLIQNIAKVVRVHASNGSLVVSSILRTNDVPNLPTGKIWVGDGNTTVSDVVYLDESNGRMGIGTTSPGAKLHVTGDNVNASEATVRIGGVPSFGNGVSRLELVENMSANVMNYGFSLTADGDSTNNLLIRNHSNSTVGNVAIAVDRDTSNVGIGTTSPSQKLEIVGNIKLSSDAPTILATSTNNSSGLRYNTTGTASDTHRFQYNGTTQLNIKSSGNVGIGTTSPLTKFHTVGSGLFSDTSYVDVSVDQTDSAKITMGITSGTTGGFINVVNTGTGHITTTDPYIRFLTNSSEKMRITSAGGISFGSTGTAYGTSGQILKSNANASPTWVDASTVIGGPYLPLTAGASYPLTGDLYVDGGSITVDPDVAGSVFTWKESDSTTVAGELRGYANRGDIYLYSNGIKKTELSSQNDSFIPALHIGGTTAASGGGLQVTGQGIFTGNVGIGTTSPSGKLTIDNNSAIVLDNKADLTKPFIGFGAHWNGSDIVAQGFSYYGMAIEAVRGYPTSSSSINFTLGGSGGSFSNLMTIRGDGNVGIGTTDPGEKLEILGNIRLRQSLSNAETVYISTNSRGGGTNDADLRLGNSNNGDVLTVHNANVGIGTTNPDSKLDVTGGNITINTIGTFFADFKYGAVGSEVSRGSITTDGIDLKVNATADLLLLPTGNVGIGTTSPTHLLTLETASSPGLKIKDTTQGATLLAFSQDSNSHVGTFSSHPLVFDTNSTERMRITSDGGISFGSTGTAYGTSGQILKSNANASPTWVDASTVIGGPYLPLVGGTLSGDLTMDDSDVVFKHSDGSNYYRVGIGASANFEIYNTNYGRTDLLITQSTGNATFAGTVTAPTFLGDLNGTINTVTTAVTKANSTNDTTVATTAFVQNLIGTIPAGLVFQGTWNAATNTPTLTSGTGTTGNFYIVSVDGSTSLDGITDWKVGDWAVFVEQGATDAWEKVDNSSVLDGSGTGQTVALWSGSGTSNTLTDSIITQTGSSPSQQIRITSENDAQLRLDGGTTSYAGIHWVDVSGNDYMWFNGSSGTFAIGGGGSGVSGKKLHIDGSTSIGSNYDAASPPTNGLVVEGNVGIGTTTPKAKLDVNGRFCVDSKTHNLTNAFTTCLTVNLSSHTGCYVTLTCFGDWGSHSAAAYRGEFFLQNGANAYAEPGIILRQDDNTSNGADQIVCQILDPTGTGNPKDFEIQIRTTATTGTTSFTGQLTYTVQGQFNSIT
jgi:hypothetical protein